MDDVLCCYFNVFSNDWFFNVTRKTYGDRRPKPQLEANFTNLPKIVRKCTHPTQDWDDGATTDGEGDCLCFG